MEFMTLPQERELNKVATIYACEVAVEKGKFPKRRFKLKDIAKLIKNKKRVGPTLVSVIKAPSVIKKHDANMSYNVAITKEQFDVIDDYIINTLGMDSWGVAKFDSRDIFRGMGIPYANVIVMIRHMKSHVFDLPKLPNMDCMLEVMEVYGKTGVASLKLTEKLRDMEFGALPNHSLGGNIDYTLAGAKANLGFIGRHGMLITNHSGSCCRISVVYTSIENLDDFLINDEDYSFGEEFCAKCGNCVRRCPYGAIYEEKFVDVDGNIHSISNPKCGSGFSHYGCAICIASCPFTKQPYEKIKSAFQKSNAK